MSVQCDRASALRILLITDFLLFYQIFLNKGLKDLKDPFCQTLDLSDAPEQNRLNGHC